MRDIAGFACAMSSAMSSAMDYLPYHEPAVTTIVIYASFILLLNAVNLILDRILYCGLIGQILIGVAWGAPGANWLSIQSQQTIVQLGYLGLILLVYEGGLSTSLSAVRQNIWLSIGIATTGIGVPIGLSFILMPMSGASPLQAFAAGAALCSTSLGTTFTVLSTCSLTTSRLGIVLTTAAMLDDLVGLIMVQVIAELGGSSSSITVATVLRPIGVSLAVVLGLLVTCRYVVLPLTRLILCRMEQHLARASHAAFIIQALFLVGIFAGATYAGTSGLFAAYLAGLTMTWWDKSRVPIAMGTAPARAPMSASDNFNSGYAAVTKVLLRPFFFASIGFSIPIAQLFTAPVLWRGFIYALLMLSAKLVTGFWLVRSPKKSGTWFSMCWLANLVPRRPAEPQGEAQMPGDCYQGATGPVCATSLENIHVRRDSSRIRPSVTRDGVRAASGSDTSPPTAGPEELSMIQPVSIYPACLLGLAMAARGEIGYLIASVAESKGVFSGKSAKNNAGTEKASQLFLVVIWAISLCTLIGPICVGLMVKRIRRLEKERGESQGRRAALGIWGIEVEN